MRTLSTFQRLSNALKPTTSATFAAALAGAGACKLRGLATGTSAVEQSKPQPALDPLDQEFDRGDDEEAARVHEAEWEARQAALKEAALKVPVDLECEFDRDDPDAVDPNELYAERAAVEFVEVDIDTEMDRDDPLLADKEHLWDCPDPPCPANIDGEMDIFEEEEEAAKRPPQAYGPGDAKPTVPRESPGGTVAGNTPFPQGAARDTRVPDERVGQYRT